MRPRDEDLTLDEELEFVPLEEELESEALDASAELELLLDRVRAARFSGA